MRESNLESLSAMADDQALELETARVLKAMADGDAQDLGERWARWHLYGAVLRGEETPLASAGLRQRVLAAMAEDDTGGSRHAEPVASRQAPQAPAQATAAATRALPSWWRHVASGAVAAAVALAVLVGFLPDTDPGGVRPAAEVVQAIPPGMILPGARQAAQQYSAPALPSVRSPVDLAPAPARTAAELELAARQRLQAYMLRHAQQRAVSDQASMLPLVRVAAFEGE